MKNVTNVFEKKLENAETDKNFNGEFGGLQRDI